MIIFLIIFPSLIGILLYILLGSRAQPDKNTPDRIPDLKQAVPRALPSQLILTKHYVTGHIRPETAKNEMPEQPEKDRTIFAPAEPPKSAMQPWSGLVVQPPIGEDGKQDEPEMPTPPAAPQAPAPTVSAELHDEEVHALLGELDAGERIQTGDATAEELQALANFDIRAFA